MDAPINPNQGKKIELSDADVFGTSSVAPKQELSDADVFGSAPAGVAGAFDLPGPKAMEMSKLSQTYGLGTTPPMAIPEGMFDPLTKPIATGHYESKQNSAINDIASVMAEKLADQRGEIADTPERFDPVAANYGLNPVIPGINAADREANRQARMADAQQRLTEANAGLARNKIVKPNFGQKLLQGTEGLAEVVGPALAAGALTGGTGVIPELLVQGGLAGGIMGVQGYNTSLANSIKEYASKPYQKGPGYVGDFHYDLSNPKDVEAIMSNPEFVAQRNKQAAQTAAIDATTGALMSVIPGAATGATKLGLTGGLKSAVDKGGVEAFKSVMEAGGKSMGTKLGVVGGTAGVGTVLGLGTAQTAADNVAAGRPWNEGLSEGASMLLAQDLLMKGGHALFTPKPAAAAPNAETPPPAATGQVIPPAESVKPAPVVPTAPEPAVAPAAVQPEAIPSPQVKPVVEAKPAPVAEQPVSEAKPEPTPAEPIKRSKAIQDAIDQADKLEKSLDGATEKDRPRIERQLKLRRDQVNADDVRNGRNPTYGEAEQPALPVQPETPATAEAKPAKPSPKENKPVGQTEIPGTADAFNLAGENVAAPEETPVARVDTATGELPGTAAEAKPTAEAKPATEAKPAAIKPVTNPVVASTEGAAIRSTDNIPVQRIATSEIKADPKLMQYKATDEADSGVNQKDKLSGKWDETKAGVVTVWKPNDPSAHGLAPGQNYIVANGHHRLDFAVRAGRPDMNVHVLKESDGWSAADARMQAAEINIADGKGSPQDAVKYLQAVREKNGEAAMDAAAKRVGSNEGARRNAEIAKGLSGDAMDLFVNDKIDARQAHAIALNAPGNTIVQNAGAKAAVKGMSPESIVDVMNTIKEMMGERAKLKADAQSQGTLWDSLGMDDAALQDMAEKLAMKVAEKRSAIDDQLRAIQGAAKRPEKAGVGGVQVKDVEKTKRFIDDLKRQREELGRWRNNPELRDKIYAEAGVSKEEESRANGGNPVEKSVEPIAKSFDEMTPEEQKQHLKDNDSSTGDMFVNESNQSEFFGPKQVEFQLDSDGNVKSAKPAVNADAKPTEIQQARKRKTIQHGEEIAANQAEPAKGDKPAVDRIHRVDLPGGKFGAVVEHAEAGSLRSGLDTVKTPADVAHVTGEWFAQRPQEVVAVVTADKNGKILGITRITTGTHTAAMFPMGIIAGTALGTPGATNVWAVHNHPSGKVQLSGPDLRTNDGAANILKKSGIKYEGLFAIAKNKYSFVDTNGNVTQGADIPQIARNKTIPITERVFTQNDTIGPRMDEPSAAIPFVKSIFGDKTGILLLNNSLDPVGSIEMTPDKMEKLRQKGGLDTLLPAIERANANNMIAYVGDGMDVSQRKSIAENLQKLSSASANLNTVDMIGDNKSYNDEIPTTFAVQPTTLHSAAGAGLAAAAAAANLSGMDMVGLASVAAFGTNDRLLKGLNPIVANMHLVAEDTGSQTVRDVANMFGQRGGNIAEGAKETYDSERNGNRRLFKTKLQKAFEPLVALSEDQIRAKSQWLAEALVGERAVFGPDAEVVKRLKAMSDELHAHMREAGMDVGYVEGYGMPHSFDVPKVLGGEARFLKDAERAYAQNNPDRIDRLAERAAKIDGIPSDERTPEQDKERSACLKEIEELQDADPAKQAEHLLSAISFGSEGGDLDQSLLVNSKPSPNGDARPTKERIFEPKARAILREWFNNDPKHAWNGYIDRMTKAAEFSRRFGQDGAKWDSMVVKMREEGLNNRQITDVKNMVMDSLGSLNPRPTDAHALANAVLGLSNMAKLKSTAVTILLESQSNAMAGRWRDSVTAPIHMLGQFLAHVAEFTPSQREIFKKYAGLDLNTETGAMELARITGMIDSVGIHQIMENSAYSIENANEVAGTSLTAKTARGISNATSRLGRSFGVDPMEIAKRTTSTRFAADRLAGHANEFLNDGILGRAYANAKPDAVNPFTLKNEARMRLRRAGVPDNKMAEFAQWYAEAVKSGDFNARIAGEEPMAKMARKAIRMEASRAAVSSGRTNKIGGEVNPLISQDTFFGKAAMTFLNYPATFREQTLRPMMGDVMSAKKGFNTENGETTFFSPLERTRMALRPVSLAAMTASAMAWLTLRTYLGGDEERIKEMQSEHWIKRLTHAFTYTGSAGGKAEFVSRAERGELFPIVDEAVRLGKALNRPDDSANKKERAATKEGIRAVGVPIAEAAVANYVPMPVAAAANQLLASKAFRESATDFAAGKQQTTGIDLRTGRPSHDSGRPSEYRP